MIVEAVSGQTLSEYIAEHVYGPLGMTDWTFEPSYEQRARLLPIRFCAPDSLETEMDLPANPEWGAAGHGSYGTVADYGRFVRPGSTAASSTGSEC